MSTDESSKITQSPHWRIIYSNIIGIGFGDNDVRLNCGFDLNISKPGSDVVEEALLVMTPRTAKMLAYTLNAVVANFEALNGLIAVPADRLQKVDEAIRAQSAENKKKQDIGKTEVTQDEADKPMRRI
jgi:hypothetical protein